jgi:hypothetical protein
VEVDTRYIKGMLSNPDIAPSASINQWIISILAFHFTLVHVPGIVHGPDGLSRRPAQPGDTPEEDDEEKFDDWIDKFYGFVHFINPGRTRSSPDPRRPAAHAAAAIPSAPANFYDTRN